MFIIQEGLFGVSQAPINDQGLAATANRLPFREKPKANLPASASVVLLLNQPL